MQWGDGVIILRTSNSVKNTLLFQQAREKECAYRGNVPKTITDCQINVNTGKKPMHQIFLKLGKEKPIRQGHPWIFSGAIERVVPLGTVVPGDFCLVLDSRGNRLGTGYYNPGSSIAVRMLTRKNHFSAEECGKRIVDSVNRRAFIGSADTTTYRLVNSEGDFVPGLIVDRYGDGICVQLLTAGIEQMRPTILKTLDDLLHPAFIYERSDTDGAADEGLPVRQGLIAGTLPEQLVVKEHGFLFAVDLADGQKSGMFIDQRENRQHIMKYALGAEVADCFCYSGGFSVRCLAAGAKRVRSIDASEKALHLAKKNRSLNGFGTADEDFVTADLFEYWRKTEDTFSLIILDPPKFAKHSREVIRASRGYKDINMLAFKHCQPGGIVCTFSCSQAIDRTLFRQIVFAAAADSGREVQVIETLGQPADHPVNIAHREGEYLKGLVLRVI